jgi:hypothetical protein
VGPRLRHLPPRRDDHRAAEARDGLAERRARRRPRRLGRHVRARWPAITVRPGRDRRRRSRTPDRGRARVAAS